MSSPPSDSENSAKPQSAPFAAFAALGERLALTSSRLERTRLVAEYLSGIDPSEVAAAARLLVGRAFSDRVGRRLSVSGRAVWQSLEAIGARIEEVRWAGAEDFGELVRRVMADRDPVASEITLADVREAFEKIAAAAGSGSRRLRIDLLSRLFGRATPVEAKYLAKIVIGEMRHGVQEGIVLDALARVAGVSAAEIRRAHQGLGDLGDVALAARSDPAALAGVAATLFRPIRPMLAQTAADVAEAFEQMGGRLALEWKLDGARVQIHKRGGEVRLFSRRMKEITASLPDVVHLVATGSAADSAVVEGEVIPVEAGRPLPFQELMRRFRRIRDVEDAIGQVPVHLYLFDLLYVDGRPMLDASADERWQALQAARGAIDCVGRIVPSDVAVGDRFFADAVAAGYEGVMAKALDSPYTPGMRGKGWLKIKHSVTLDLVVVAADWGYGRRHGWLSNYHLAARDRATGELMPVGKTFKGLTDAQFQSMTERLEALAIEERGGTVFVRPEVVVEVRFNDIQRSPNYACGMALRFARIAAIRTDKRPDEADTIETMRALYERQGGR